jgi:hypothetical protein
MKIPPATDPRWNAFIRSEREFPLKCLASRIMYGQVRIVARRDPDLAIRLACEYFQKNQVLAADDLRTVLGPESHG